MKDKEPVTPLIGIGTTLEVSGHPAIVTSITKEGVECKVAKHIVVLDFDKIVLALQQLNNV
jgi:hypothetical protein